MSQAVAKRCQDDSDVLHGLWTNTSMACGRQTLCSIQANKQGIVERPSRRGMVRPRGFGPSSDPVNTKKGKRTREQEKLGAINLIGQL